MVNRWAQGAPYGTTAIPYIGENGNWWVNQEDTGVKAQGPQGPQGLRGEAGIGAPGPALMYEDMTEEQKLELASHYTDDMQAIKDSCIADTNALIATAKTEMDATKAAALEEAATIAEEKTAGIVNAAVENAQAEIDASVATATTNINAAAANAENSKVAAQEAANSATATLESMQNIKQEAITAAQNAAAETATSTVNTLVEQAQADIDANITEAKNVATAAATNADASKVEANTSANSAASSATAAANSATEANAAKVAAEAAANSVTLDADAMNAAVQASKSYAVGGTGTREGEDADNSKYYYGLCKTLVESNGSSFLGDCRYSELPADAPIGTIYRIIGDEETGGGFAADLNDEATRAKFDEAIAMADTFEKKLEAYAIILPKMYEPGSLFIKTAAGWEPFTQQHNNILLDTMCVLGRGVDSAGGGGASSSLLETIGYAKISNMSELPDNIFADNCAGVNVTDGSYTFTQEAASYTIHVAKANTDGSNTVGECVLTNSLNLRSGNVYTIVPLVDYNCLDVFRITLVNTADDTVILELTSLDFVYVGYINSTTSFKSLSLDKDVVAKVILHVEDSSVSEDGATINLGIFDYTVRATQFLTVDKRLNGLSTSVSFISDKLGNTLRTLEEVDANTEGGHLVDALAIKQLNRNFAYDENGIYGYCRKVDGADTVIPFSSGDFELISQKAVVDGYSEAEVSYTYTSNTKGKILVFISTDYETNPGTRTVYVKINGVEQEASITDGRVILSHTLTNVQYLLDVNVGDIVEVYAYVQRGGNSYPYAMYAIYG